MLTSTQDLRISRPGSLYERQLEEDILRLPHSLRYHHRRTPSTHHQPAGLPAVLALRPQKAALRPFFTRCNPSSRPSPLC